MKYIQPDWPAPKQVKAFTTLRNGWGSKDANSKDPAVRRSLTTLLQLPEEPIWLNQTHSTIAIEAKPENIDKTADASHTAQTGRICIILTADCLPILICNRQGTHVAAIHAGWRGLAGGIIEETLNALHQPADELLVWLGPAIGPNKFEVGSDVYTAFTANNPANAAAFKPHTEGKWLADLYALARLRLQSWGVSQIYGGNYCTHSLDDLFFSYRRDQGQTGRMASLIWIDG